jgi:hypothetical protein
MKQYREDAKNLLRKGGREKPYECLIDGFAIGGERFRESLLKMAKGGERETVGKSVLRRRIDVEQALVAVEAAKRESRDAFLERYGDRGEAMAMLLLRRHGGITLKEIGDAFWRHGLRDRQ